ncbi:MAG: alpha/beta hydrolase [Methylocystis sp.]|nr:alpha/beta hydrolase [Methylocystis sp.]
MPSALNFKNFEARLGDAPSVLPRRQQRTTADAGGIDLAYEVYAPAGDFSDLLVFYHGGGANMRAGYNRLATELVSRSPLAVCLTDMRGHGASGGRRGHAESPADVWKDVDRLVAQLARDFPGVRIHLGGHSSAAGMLLNYRTLYTPQADVCSLILLAPEFGFRAKLYRSGTAGSGSFARLQIWPFLLHSISGGYFGGGISAVALNYKGSQGPEIGYVQKYTVNMAIAVTPKDPAGQLARFDLPTWIGIAGDDELIDAEKLDVFIARHAPPCVRREALPGTTHLEAILDAHAPILTALDLDHS